MLFDNFNGYGFVHHRALNDPEALDEAINLVERHPARTQILEGDLCWDFEEGRKLFYFRHPSYVVDTLAPGEIEDGLRTGKLVGFNDLEKLVHTNAYIILELKVGRGDWKNAMTELLAFMEARFSARYWVDGFSLTMLEYIKRQNPSTVVTLHTECVFRGTVVVGAPEVPPLRFMRLSHLPLIDGIAIRRRGTESFMARACDDVHRSGKALILSRLHNLRHFELSKVWGAKAGYMHWDFEELLAFNDKLDEQGKL